MENLYSILQENSYPGRGIMIGKSKDGEHAVIAYFIMGRSQNSRNRVFSPKSNGIITEAADKAMLEDPSLIIYAPVRVAGNSTIVTNGDQTDTIYDAFSSGNGFAKALRTRKFEPDSPNFTPRISGVVKVKSGEMKYKLSILKSAYGDENSCLRFFYDFDEPINGMGHFIHTYKCDGNPIPSFEGDPVPVEIDGSIDFFGENLWQALNESNKVSLFVRYISIQTGGTVDRIYNKYDKID